ncbi:nondiscriminating aspartyl-tRNA synthetase [Longilinea arvoryzae]|uniref:Aspartate--tRNA ligase n=1 Tax=Longilinea arvoryzae TaxID=360412 RepID=A0A0S7BM82_9CHLR|nr:aspartate--tRNA(Asn) ligase [Longilinea arvoryzae]GAP15622.1 nondiscriminating aspartyl-tRNA synthetase [Longilinea arvoryzae]
MERTFIADLRQHIGEEVKIQGWLQVLRDQKKMQFLVVRDTTSTVQVAFWKGNDAALAEQISTLTTESALTITGTVVDNPVVKLGGLELQLASLEVNNLAESPMPFEPYGDTLPQLDFRMDWRYLDLRRKENLLLFQVQTTAEFAMREFCQQNRFVEIHTPKIVGAPSESGAELFTIEYFDRKAYLAQSPQFYKQMAMAAGFERVFEIGPVFRADPSFTSRHMTEFTGVDMEISWTQSHEDVMAIQERWLNHIYQRVKDVHGEQIREVFNHEIVVPTLPFPRIPMAEVIQILKQRGYQLPADKKGDIDPGGEREIAAYVKEKYNHDFVFVTDWPITARPFYHMRHPNNPNLTMSYDLIANGLEITTGAQREHRPEILKKQALEKGLHLEPIQFYLDFFRFGCPPHGGFGLGLSRLLMVMLGLNNIRESVFLFRGPTRLIP